MTYPIKAVIFDWAGTMVDFGCMAPVQALIDAFAVHGVTITPAQARRDMGRAKRDHVAGYLARPFGLDAAKNGDNVPMDVSLQGDATGDADDIVGSIALGDGDILPKGDAVIGGGRCLCAE